MNISRTSARLTPFLLAAMLAACGGDNATCQSADECGGGLICVSFECKLGDPAMADTDGDGLTDADELAGWEVVIDELGYGLASDASFLTRRLVTSDPTKADTDGDGLTDAVEYAERSDPRDVDTDGDQLTDAEELRYNTALSSVDSDGDARDETNTTLPLPALFDGAELAAGTSPTLADTDGDGKDDREERDVTNRDPRIAEIPQLDMVAAGEIDIRLRVEYTTGEQTEVEYGSVYSTTNASSTERSDTESTAVTTAASSGGEGFFDDLEFSKEGAIKFFGGKALELGRSAACASAKEGGEVKFEKDNPNKLKETVGVVADSAGAVLDATGLDDTELCAEATPETVNTTSTTLTSASSQSATNTSSEYRRETQTREERTAEGEVRLGFTFVNTGISTVELVNPSITMMQWAASPSPDAPLGGGTFRTVATLTTDGGGQLDANGNRVFSLSPSGAGSSAFISMSNTAVNADLIKGFLARPEALFFSPGQFDLHDRDGVSFDFLVEETYNRTAALIIDNGREPVKRYQIATNVERTEDGDFAGVRMGTVLRDILEIPFTTRAVDRRNEAGETVQVEELHSIEGSLGDYANERTPNRGDPAMGVAGDPQAFWIISVRRPSEARADLPFEDVRFFAGDEVRLVYVRDADGDGLMEREEHLHGTDDSIADTDGDGVSDFAEIKNGWTVNIAYDDAGTEATVAYRVTSNPRHADGDGDGIDDLAELLAGTDPNNADTDDDGLADNCENLPLDARDAVENGVCDPITSSQPAAIYVTDGTSLKMLAIDTEGALSSVSVQDMPATGDRTDMALTPDKRHLLVNTGRSSAYFLQVFDVDPMSDELTFNPFTQPQVMGRGSKNDRSVVIDPQGRYVWSIDENSSNEEYATWSFELNRDQVPGRLEMPMRDTGNGRLKRIFLHPNGQTGYAIDDDDALRKINVDRSTATLGVAMPSEVVTDVVDIAIDAADHRVYFLTRNGQIHRFEVDRENGNISRLAGPIATTGHRASSMVMAGDMLLVVADDTDRTSQTIPNALYVFRIERAQDGALTGVDQNTNSASLSGSGQDINDVAFDETGARLYTISDSLTREWTLSEDGDLTPTSTTLAVGGRQMIVMNRVR